jgi:DNA polymerase-3 subunit delta
VKEIDQILLDLKRRIYKPVYFLSGEEAYYIDLVSDYIEKNVLEDTEREFNQVVVYGRDTSLANILSFAKQFPMMGDKVVVIVKEAQHIRELNKGVKPEDAEEDAQEKEEPASVQELLSYLENPQDSTILVFCYKYKKIDKRGAIAKALQKRAVFVETKKLYDNQLPDWISTYLKENKYSISPKIAFLIAEALGSDLSKVAMELDKLMINLPEGGEISADMVQQQIGISKDFNVFELQKALTQKDILKANRIIQHFAGNPRENPAPLVLAQLYAYFSKVMRYHYLTDKSKFAAATALGVNPFFLDDYARASINFPLPKLKHIIAYLKECDLKSKGVDNVSADYGELLKELVFKILH